MSDGKNLDALFSDLPPDCVVQPCPAKPAAGQGQNASNGKASNDKGNTGVNMRLAEINSIKGATVLGRNVTIVTESGVRSRPILSGETLQERCISMRLNTARLHI